MSAVDLRSDTVTQPTAAMKQAMVDAPLGDDVLGDDPTVQRLEAVMAERTGKEGALFMPSGTMTNLVAIRIHTQPGDELLLHEWAHPFNYEAGGAAAFAGVQIRPLTGPKGQLEPDTVRAAIHPPDHHFAPARLLAVEDTANRGGGSVYPLERLDAVGAVAHEMGLATHLDGARVFNAVVASGIPLARRAKAYDTISCCFSKGLGAPVGSVLCGPCDLLHVGHRMRKLLGGTMRQSGMLAAAALYALEHNVARLAEDHRRTRDLEAGLTAMGYEVTEPETNMVYIDVPDGAKAQDDLETLGVRCFAADATTLRLVVHLHVTDEDVQTTLNAFQKLAAQT